MKRIAVVEDELYMREELCSLLRKAGYEALEITVFEDAAEQMTALAPDLVLLDINLPEISGFQICRDLKQKTAIPVLVLTSRDQMQDELQALRLGADDFIPKPFDNAEVLARVEAQLRRYKQFSGGGGSAVLTHGDLTLDRESVTVTAAGKPVTVTAREFDILTLLMEHPKKVFTREQLYEQVWGGEYMGDDNTVNVHISNLRAKLAKASPAEYIKTVWGIGFKMSDL